MKICSKCILPETFPGIRFNSDNLCIFCQKFEGKGSKLAQDKKIYERRFLGMLKQLAPRNGQTVSRPYDILMAYSGGKDSTYTMSLLSNKYKLKVLAVSFDNGFISERCLVNIRNVTENLGIDHIFFRPQWGVLKKIFVAASERELYSRKTLERASTICTSCMGIVKSSSLKMAIEQGIPMIGFGWSPGQAPLQSSIMKNNPSLTRATQRVIMGPLREIAGDEIDAYFLQERHYAAPERFPYNVHPMAWEIYNEEMMLREIRKVGWEAPLDTDRNSTNCLLNAFANDIHLKKYGFHPYAWEIANMVREGVITRAEGCERIYGKHSSALSDAAKKRLSRIS